MVIRSVQKHYWNNPKQIRYPTTPSSGPDSLKEREKKRTAAHTPCCASSYGSPGDFHLTRGRQILTTDKMKGYAPPSRVSDYWTLLSHVTPSFDNSYPKNVTTQLGQTVYLHCVVNNLGDKTVSITYCLACLVGVFFFLCKNANANKYVFWFPFPEIVIRILVFAVVMNLVGVFVFLVGHKN
ncbi:uncharacterized protein CDAR_187171 [Caerostris darwini]|uniref:Uncharacterized protein n=1 Tax=Caerostris darwini TaxID=1538125 RepID=A0AAV4P3B5_9ARAC|nr:uncharacterized protein CDAR_187171 [Caerostris darwini]